MAISNEQIVNLPFLYINNMIASWASNTTLSITAGQCRDSTNVDDIVVNATATLNTAVTGLNGLDTGVLLASKMYAIYAISDITANPLNPAGYLMSLSMTAPLLPFGYGAYRLIGYWSTDASVHLLLGYISATNSSSRTFTYDAVQATAITAGAATTYTAIDLTNLVPVVDNTPVSLLVNFIPGAASRTANLQPTGATGDAILITGQVTSVHVTQTVSVLAKLSSAAPKVSYKVSNAGDAVAISVLGFSYAV